MEVLEEHLNTTLTLANGRPNGRTGSLHSTGRSTNGQSQSPGSISPGNALDGMFTLLGEFTSASAVFCDSMNIEAPLLSTPELNSWVQRGFLVPLEAEGFLHLLQHYPFIVALGMKFYWRLLLLLVSNGGQAAPLSPMSSSCLGSSIRRFRSTTGSRSSISGTPKGGGSSGSGSSSIAVIAPETRVRSQFSVSKCASWGYAPRRFLTVDVVTAFIKSNNVDAAMLAIGLVTRPDSRFSFDPIGVAHRPPELSSMMEKWIIAIADSSSSSSSTSVLTRVLSLAPNNHQVLFSGCPHILRKMMSDATLLNIEVLLKQCGTLGGEPLVLGTWELGMLSAGLQTRYKTEKTLASGLAVDAANKADLVIGKILAHFQTALEQGCLRFSCPHANILNINAIATAATS